MPQINPALNVLRGPRQVVRVMYQRVQVWPPFRKFCDYFERPDGPLGPTWMPGIIRRTGGYDECTTIDPYIVDGHVEGDEDAPPALMATATEIVFYDDFDRDPGPLGPNWIPAAVPMDGGAVRPMPEIEIFRVWDPETDPTIDQARYAFPAALMTGDYTVDLKIDNVVGLNNSIGVLAGFDTNLASGLEFGFISDGSIALTGRMYVIEWFHGAIDSSSSIGPATTVKPWYLRIEKQGTTYSLSYAPEEGTPVFVFVGAYDRPGYNGQHVGMRIEHRAEALFTPYIAWLKVTKQVEAVHLLNDVMTVETYIGDQFVEIVTDNVHQGNTGARVCDEFDRADGPIGPNWVMANVGDWGQNPTGLPFTISNGAAVGTATYTVPYPYKRSTTMQWTAAQGADQSIELEVENFVGNNGLVNLYTNSNTTDAACMGLFVHMPDGGEETDFVISRFNAGGGPTMLASQQLPNSALVEPFRVRFESLADGTQTAYLNGESVLTTVDASALAGPYVAMGVFIFSYEGSPYDSPRIERACIGSGGVVEGPFILYCQANTKNLCCTAVWCEYTGNDLTAFAFQQNALGQVATVVPSNRSLGSGSLTNFALPGDPVCKLRLEVGRDGHLRFLATDDLSTTAIVILDLMVPALSGDRVGFAFMWRGEEATSYHILEVCGGLTEIPTVPDTGDLLFVLDWATEPYDLDFHMSGPAGPHGVFPGRDGFPVPGRFHTAYYQEWPVFHSFLDYDDTTSFGPEYMMILGAHPEAPSAPPTTSTPPLPPVIYQSAGYVPGDYAVWVNLYTGAPDSNFATSDATVRMYRKPGGSAPLVFDSEHHLVVDLAEWQLVDTFRVGESSGDLTARTLRGPNWHVCDVHLTSSTYTMTRVMQIEPGDHLTHVFPD